MKKLTEALAKEIRKQYYTGTTSLRKLATQYQVCHQTIYLVVNGATWTPTIIPKLPKGDEGFEYLDW